MNLRGLDDKEWEQICDVLAHYGCPLEMLGRSGMRVREGRYREVFAASEHVLDIVSGMGDVPLCFGMKAGEFSKGSFRPSLELGTLLHAHASANTVALDSTLAAKYLYGRDIFREHLDAGMKLGRKLVGTVDGEFLGFGIYNGRALANIVDKGAYLRQFR